MIKTKSIHEWIGTSSETKPTASSQPIGSRYFESDTKDTYLDSGSSWVIDPESKPFDDLVAGCEKCNYKSWRKLAFNSNVSTTNQDIWAVGGAYVYPTVAQGMVVSSANVADTASGTGARTVQVNYLTSSFDEKMKYLP